MPTRHTVQFFQADESSLLHNLCNYVAEGLEAGEPVVVLTERERRDRLFLQLELSGTEPDIGKQDGRLVVLDSDQLLAKIFSGGTINGERFNDMIGRAMREVVSRSRSRRVRAYGDLVGTLWKAGRHAAAVDLERYWNDLQAQIPFDLYCGYPIDLFGDDFHPAKVDPLLCQHSHVVAQSRNAELQSALDFAMYETFGRRLRGSGSSIKEQIATTWPELPSPEATILWIREYLPSQAGLILERARRYSEAAA
jgi:hypothetical protein